MSTASDRRVASRQIQLPRLRLHYLDWPAIAVDAGPTLLLVHPNRTSANVWRPFVAASRLPNRIVAPDLRGHGDSEWPDVGYTVHDCIADLRELATALDLPPMVLIGGAIGATTVLVYATQHPEEVVGVAANDIAFALDATLLRRVQNRIRTQVVHDSPEEALLGDHAVDHMDADALRRFMDDMFMPTEDGRVRWRYHPPGVAAMMEPLSPPLPQVVDVRCPTLLLRGTESKPLSRENLARLAAHIPGAQTAEVSDADHILSLDNPTAYATLIDEWVEEVVM